MPVRLSPCGSSQSKGHKANDGCRASPGDDPCRGCDIGATEDCVIGASHGSHDRQPGHAPDRLADVTPEQRADFDEDQVYIATCPAAAPLQARFVRDEHLAAEVHVSRGKA